LELDRIREREAVLVSGPSTQDVPSKEFRGTGQFDGETGIPSDVLTAGMVWLVVLSCSPY